MEKPGLPTRPRLGAPRWPGLAGGCAQQPVQAILRAECRPRPLVLVPHERAQRLRDDRQGACTRAHPAAADAAAASGQMHKIGYQGR
jgi:hypothetical protein